MARLGKRERHAKRALIKANLSSMADGTFERSSGAVFADGSRHSAKAISSRLDTTHLLEKSHTMGARVPQNMKGTEGKRSVAGRWSNNKPEGVNKWDRLSQEIRAKHCNNS